MTGVFENTITQLILLFAFILAGFFLGKRKIVPSEAAGILARLETWLFMPAFTLRSCAQNCKIENVKEYITYIGISAATIIVLVILTRFLAKRFAQNRDEIGIYNYAFAVSNMGYMGYPMMQAMFGETMLFKMMITVIPVNIYIYTVGMASMTGKKASLRSLINPVFIGTCVGILIGLTGIELPTLANNFLSSAANCMSPIAMLISGLVISRLPLGKLFSSARIYVASILRLIVLPAMILAVFAFLGAPVELLAIMLVTYAMPIGMNTIVFPEAHGIDARAGAQLVLISNLMSILTIPIMVLLFLQIFPVL